MRLKLSESANLGSVSTTRTFECEGWLDLASVDGRLVLDWLAGKVLPYAEPEPEPAPEHGP